MHTGAGRSVAAGGMAGRLLAGLVCALASLAAVAIVTGAIELLKPHIPVLSLGALYVFAVLPIAVLWGTAFGVAVAIASMLAFNFFFLPPLYTLTLRDSRNWFALLVFVVTAIVVSELAARSRRQARASALLAQIASSLLEHGEVSGELDRIGREAARALGVEQARIELGRETALQEGETELYPLSAGGRRVGTIFMGHPRRGTEAARRRLLPPRSCIASGRGDRP